MTLDNQSRCYCEYIRHLYLMNQDLVQVRSFVQIVNQVNPLSQEEWKLLYARLFFPTQFYDALFSLREGEKVNIPLIYKHLAMLNYSINYHMKCIEAI